jgi:tetratricopeptide (TPR) repeat protein
LVQLDRGDFKAAEANLLKGAAAAEGIGHRFYLGLAWIYLGRLRTAQGQSAQAEQLLTDSLQIFEELGAQDNLIDTNYYLGENCFAAGDLSQALEYTRRADEIMSNADGDERSSSVQRGRILRLYGAIARLSGEVDRAQTLLRESVEIFNASSERLEGARTAFEFGLLSNADKNYLEARQYFQEARLIFRQLGADLDLRRTEEALHQLSM